MTAVVLQVATAEPLVGRAPMSARSCRAGRLPGRPGHLHAQALNPQHAGDTRPFVAAVSSGPHQLAAALQSKTRMTLPDYVTLMSA